MLKGKRGLPGPRGNSGRAGPDGPNVRENTEIMVAVVIIIGVVIVVGNNSDNNDLLISGSLQGLPGLPGSTGPPVSMMFKVLYETYITRKAQGELGPAPAAQRDQE